MKEKDGLRRINDLVERFVPATVDGEHRNMIYPGEDPRVIRIIKKIVRGLSHYHGVEDEVDDARIRADVLRYSVPDDLWSTGTFCKSGSDVFRYWFKSFDVDDKELSSLWILTFFDRRVFIAVVDVPNRAWPALEERETTSETT